MYFFKSISIFCIVTFNIACFNRVRAEFTKRNGVHSKSSSNFPEPDITIIEGDSLWGRKKTQGEFETSSVADPYKLTGFDDTEQNSKFSTSALKRFLDHYAEKIRNEKYRNATEIVEEKEEVKDKKSWNLMSPQRQKHPFEDPNGWVSLDPIPWSISQVSKWRNKHKPTELSFDPPVEDIPLESDLELSTVSDTSQNYHKYKYPSSLNDYQIISPNENNLDNTQIRYKRPPLQRPSIENTETYNTKHKTNKVNNQQLGKLKHQTTIFSNRLTSNLQSSEKPNLVVSDNMIITDGLLPDFPHTDIDYNRRQGTELYPETHPFTGNGNWVLLSTSKGYKRPKKQRAIKVQQQQFDEHKKVQLEVLPPLEDSKLNMTTSHGGLLQVESSLESVEQAQKKMEKLQNLKKKRRRRPINLKKRKKIETFNAVSKTVPRSTDSGAVLAGVGAGLIPATMAMFVPMVMNGNKRKKRE
ncbi:uncharacterized protein LOC130453111, partial [Diorhabda sublineata]|uniref:uncharacterized protein LOC130453111 n=1 Tax=Diorhabda sublineata TaxID=1163346 RepID=UPI0024E05E90